MSTDGPYFPEFDLTPEQRLEAAAKILLDAVREMYGERNRQKTRRCRARKAVATPTAPLDGEREQSRHGDEVSAPSAASAPT